MQTEGTRSLFGLLVFVKSSVKREDRTVSAGYRVRALWTMLCGLTLMMTGCGILGAPRAHPTASPGLTARHSINWVTGNTWQSRRSLWAHHPVIVDFFATWCPACAWMSRWTMPRYQTWAQQHGIMVVGIVVSPNGGIGIAGPFDAPEEGRVVKTGILSATAMADLLRRYRQQFHLYIPLGIDPGRAFIRRYDPGQSFPMIVFFNSRQQPLGRAAGITTYSQLVQATMATYRWLTPRVSAERPASWPPISNQAPSKR